MAIAAGSWHTVALVVGVAPANIAPSITAQPSNQTMTAGANATFTVGASGVPAPAFRWQISSDNGGTWSNLGNTLAYSGTDSETVAITAVPLSFNGYRFRCVATNTEGSAISDPANLTVSPQHSDSITLTTLTPPSLPAPTAAPSATAFPAPQNLATGLTSFYNTNRQSFDAPTQNFFDTELSGVANWLLSFKSNTNSNVFLTLANGADAMAHVFSIGSGLFDLHKLFNGGAQALGSNAEQLYTAVTIRSRNWGSRIRAQTSCSRLRRGRSTQSTFSPPPGMMFMARSSP
jgi:hypothetical protein